MHHALERFIDEFERQAKKQGVLRRRIGSLELQFLEKVFGPEFQYNFEGLHAEYPLKDFKGGDRFVDFVYIKGGIRLIIELDGFTTHVRDISSEEYEDHLERQNDLILQGWIVLRFSRRQVELRSMKCRRQIKQAIGHWWSMVEGNYEQTERSPWQERQRRVTRLALRQGGLLKNRDLALAFNISLRSAQQWMRRFVEEGAFEPVAVHQRVTSYRLRGI